MKKSVKALLLVMCAIVLVVATVFTTLAYLQDATQTITNTFTVGNVDIKLDEADVDANGDLVGTIETRTEESQSDKVIPGKEYTKDPTIRVQNGSESSWVFAKIESSLPNNIVTGFAIASGWTLLPDSGEGLNAVYYREYEGTNADNYKVFAADTFTVNTGLTNEQIADATVKTIKVTGYAIQKDNGIADAVAAWAIVSAPQA